MNLEQIDTSTTAGKAEVMRLAAEGRRVAARSLFPGSGWKDCPAPVWDWHSGEYAIISEPVGPEEVFVAFNMAGELLCARYMEADAERSMRRNGSSGYAVRYIRADLAGEAK